MSDTVLNEPDEPTLIDDLAAEAAPEPEEYPDGAPELKPYLQIRPRSKRAEFKRKYADFARRQGTVNALMKASKDVEDVESPTAEQAGEKMKLWADADDLYQEMDDLMRLASVDPEKYAVWSDEVADDELIATFKVYMKRSQPGEASSSAT